jgi:sulfane dehydrogenase subunit SoxC
MHEQGRPLEPYGQPSAYERSVIRLSNEDTPTALAGWNFTPLGDMDGIITPNGLHFERNHAGVPDIDPAAHRLLVHGLVKRPMIFDMDAIRRYPTVSRIHFIECSGNTGTEWTKPTGTTVAQTHGLLSCAEWTGVPVAAILDDLGVDPAATWVLAEGADAAAMDRSIPISKLRDDAVLAYIQNGEPIRPSQGYPLRLLLPGYEGNMNVKWLRRLKFMRAPAQTAEETAYYTELFDEGKARQFNFVMEAKSVITSPSGGQSALRSGFCQIRGLAWSGNGKIRSVDVSTDGGATWNAAQLQDPVMPKCLTRFRYDWTFTNSPATLQSRCTDDTGYVQPTREALDALRFGHGAASHYHMNAIAGWHVSANGEVANVHV